MPDIEDGGSTDKQKQLQWDALGSIRVLSFTANPATVAPFGTTTLSWQLQIPSTIRFEVQFLVNGQTFHGNHGTTTVPVVGGGVFSLLAKSPLVERPIGSVPVNSDDSQCVQGSIDPTVFAAVVRGSILDSFPATDRFSFRGDGPAVTLELGTVTAKIPLRIKVPDWFDADADFKVQLNIRAEGPVNKVDIRASVANVQVNIDWSLLGAILSLGCQDAVKLAMEKVCEAFVTQIVQAQSIPNAESGLKDQVAAVAKAAKQNDKQRRDFALTSFLLSPEKITFTVCPKPKASGGSGGGGGGNLPHAVQRP